MILNTGFGRGEHGSELGDGGRGGDGLGRLVGVQRETDSGPEWIARYGYDAEGRVAFRENGSGSRTWILRDGDRAVLEVDLDADGTEHPVRRNVWLGSRLVRSEEPTASGWDLPVYAHQDRLGSVVLTTKKDADGAVSVTGRSTYDPYGKEVSLPSWTGSSVTVPYGFAGARRDDEVGLYRMGARWYDPELGRFLEQDPIGESGGLNLYAYVGSSPVMWVDPSGLAPRWMRQMRSFLGKTARRVGNFIGQVLIDGVNTANLLTGVGNMGAFASIARRAADAIDDMKAAISRAIATESQQAAQAAASEAGLGDADKNVMAELRSAAAELLWGVYGGFLNLDTANALLGGLAKGLKSSQDGKGKVNESAEIVIVRGFGQEQWSELEKTGDAKAVESTEDFVASWGNRHGMRTKPIKATDFRKSGDVVKQMQLAYSSDDTRILIVEAHGAGGLIEIGSSTGESEWIGPSVFNPEKRGANLAAVVLAACEAGITRNGIPWDQAWAASLGISREDLMIWPTKIDAGTVQNAVWDWLERGMTPEDAAERTTPEPEAMTP